MEAVRIADRFRGSPTSAFSQYQAFAYAMTGRGDLVSELQRSGRVPSAAVCSDTPGLEYRDALETIVEAATRHRAVILQEMHWEAQHRALLHALFPRLREEGFTYFAAEDFEGRPETYLTASYPGEAPGFHSTRELPDPDFPGDAPMVARLKALSGIDPLTLDQTMCRLPDSTAESAAVIAFEPDDVSPIDRIYLGADEALPLLLPSGEFRVTARPGDGGSHRVVVE